MLKCHYCNVAVVQEISRNRSFDPAPDEPTGRITVSLPYDGDKCFTRDAVRDVEQHLKRRDPHDGDVEALIGHLVLANISQVSRCSSIASR